MILLDTHTLIWLDADDQKLGVKARTLIAQAYQTSGVAVCAISFWECAMLAQRGRIALPSPADIWRGELLANGLIELPLDGPVVIRAALLESSHKDPADRFIAATALHHRITLVTADERLLAGIPALKTQDARL